MSSLSRNYFSPTANQKATVGDTKFSALNQDHLGWLKCDGRALNVKDFYFLYRVIGTSFGGSGTTFNLPNPAGRVPGAIGAGTDLTVRNLGDLSGEETHTLTIPEMPSHDHTGTTDLSGTGVTVNSAGAHTHNVVSQNDDFNNSSSYGGNFHNGSFAQADSGSKTWDQMISSAGSHSHAISDPQHNHTFTTGLTGGDRPHNNIQPTIFMGNMFIFSGKITYGNYPYTGNGNIY
jgi:microcystin-dependent protein